MTDWQKIKFEDIRKGDRIKAVAVENDGFIETLINIVADNHANSWTDARGRVIASPTDDELWLDPESRPSEPEIEVGTAGTVLAFDMKLRGIKNNSGYIVLYPNGEYGYLFDDGVNDFLPDSLLTYEVMEQVRADERERLANVFLYGFAPIPGLTPEACEKAVEWLRNGGAPHA